MRNTSSVASGLVLVVVPVLVAMAPVACAPIPPPETPGQTRVDAAPTPHQPLHKGGANLATGLYIRENDDLVVDGAPALVLRRTYLSGYREPLELGIGTRHPGEDYLIGDGEQFQWAELILARGSRIRFHRISPGTSYLGAVFGRDNAPDSWRGAQLSWAGSHWTLRHRDGSVSAFRPCGQGHTGLCSILRSTDAMGRTIQYRRDADGTLLRMESGAGRWIAFDYDERRRISRAYDSNNREVRYAYDDRGRLVRVEGPHGVVRRYGYTDLDELATIDEPGASIENIYQDGRVVRQLNYYPDRPPFVFDLTYRLEGGRIVNTHTRRSNGSWTEFAWDDAGYSLSETRGWDGFEPVVFTHERDPVTRTVKAVTVSCSDDRGRPVRHSDPVSSPGTPQQIDDVKRSLMQRCTWRPAPGEPPGGRLAARGVTRSTLSGM